MDIFKSLSLYLCLLGFVFAAIYSRETVKPELPAKYIQKPSASPYEKYIAASGIVESVDKNVEMGTPVEGIVERLFVKVGDVVKAGAPLFQIDTRELAAHSLVLQTNVSIAKADLKKQTDQLSRFQSVQDARVITQDELQQKTNEVAIAAAKLKNAEAEILKNSQLIQRQTIRAPKDGTILRLNIRVGEFVSKNTSAIILGDLDHLQIRISIDEQNAGLFIPHAKAVAFPKNNTKVMIPLSFVRVEPYVIPKKNLTGSSEERVDTRVLDVIYAFHPPEHYQMYVGQQMDVFIQRETRTVTE